MEILLSYLEFKQYELYVNQLMNKTVKKDINLDNIPTSNIINMYSKRDFSEYILNTNDNTTPVKYMVYDLYCRYIKDGSEYQINVSYTVKEQLSKIVDNKKQFIENININLDELSCIFKDCCREMYVLMNASLNRALKRSEISTKLKEAIIV